MQISSGRPSPFQVGFVLGEGLLMAVGALLALYFRLEDTSEIFTWRYGWHRILLVPLVLQVAYFYSDLYNFRVARPFLWTISRLAQATALGVLALAVIYYLVPGLFLGRGVLGISGGIIFILMLFWRGVYGWALRQRLFATRVLMVASGSLADAIIEELISRSDNIFSVVCILDLSPGARDDDDGHAGDKLNLLGAWSRLLKAELRRDPGELQGLVRHYQADMVVVAMDEKRSRMPVEELLRLRMLGVPIVGGEDFFEMVAGRILATRILPAHLIFSEGFAHGALRSFTKRTMDVMFSALGLLLSSPLALITALAVRVDSPGPVIYRQERVGQHGRLFAMFKFRSMVADAEHATGPVWSQEGDQRVTRVGRVIRKLRLDEIPQMYNVLRGDMSFVGPRPERALFVQRLSERLPYYGERHNVKPGITGWAQICFPYGSSEAAALEKLNYDLYYIKHSSLSMDVLVIIQTVKIILFGGGGR
jgi:sugar transferase (PEP-CTERM system associated)